MEITLASPSSKGSSPVSLPPFEFSGAYAVLTGAASGMGEQMAYQLADRGTHLVLVDRDAERLENVAGAIHATHRDLIVHTEVADLSEIDGLEALGRRILRAAPQVTLLINNAGVAASGGFTELSAAEFDKVMDINFRAPVTLTRLLLPALQQNAGSHIVNVSSIFGLIAFPGQSAYVSSKFAIRGFSEVLRLELAKHDIGVSAIYPGGIRTRIAENALVAAKAAPEQVTAERNDYAKLLTFPADQAAAQILTAVQNRKTRVLIGMSAVLPDFVARMFPSHYVTILTRRRRKNSSSVPPTTRSR
jgi:short-subunit dehydrogenase